MFMFSSSDNKLCGLQVFLLWLQENKQSFIAAMFNNPNDRGQKTLFVLYLSEFAKYTCKAIDLFFILASWKDNIIKSAPRDVQLHCL